MTREEAKTNAMNITGEDVIEDGIIFLRLLNESYDDFESRTCDNCKHWNQEHVSIGICHMCVDTEKMPDLHEYVTRIDFGCNKFERKEDEYVR